ncbi:MAG: flagellar hook-associated protein FlgK [Anaerolineales bacterium]
MGNLLQGLNTALSSLLSNQIAIQTTEHNVANASTPGYRRQEAVMVPGIPYSVPSMRGQVIPGQIGTGVLVDRIRQYNLEFFDDRYRRILGESKNWDMQASVLKQVEASLSETSEDGLIQKLDAFWSGWQGLSDDPTNMSLRADLLERADALASAIRWRYESLTKIQKDQNLTILERVDEINSLASQIARLNVEIVTVQAAGNQPNDITDQRDQLINRLAEISGASASIQENGEAVVSIGGHALVIGATTFKLSATSGNLSSIYWETDNQSLNVSRGELAGLFNARDQIIPNIINGLNDLASNLVTTVNALHVNGYALDGSTTGLNFFDPTATTAADIRLSSDVTGHPENIAAAQTSASPGDGNLALQIAQIRDQAIMSSGQETLNQYYTRKVAELGISIAHAETYTKDRQAVADSLDQLRQAVSGVNLDEEAANLIRYQRGFEAATRMISVIDQMLDKIINGMGIVGR